MGLCLTTLAICKDCPFFEATTVKFESDNMVYRTEVLCETYDQCKRAYEAKMYAVGIYRDGAGNQGKE